MSFQLVDFDHPMSDFDTNENSRDTSIDLGPDIDRERTLAEPSRRGKRARPRHQSSNGESSHYDETPDNDSTEDVPWPKHKKPKHRHVHPSKRDMSRSPSQEDRINANSPSLSQASEKETDSPLPTSDGLDSVCEEDWESLLCEDIEMLPPSNWEADFAIHQAQTIARSDYKGFRYVNLMPNNGNNESEEWGSNDEPWHPYDPEKTIEGSYIETRLDSAKDKLKEEEIICYGVIHKRRVKVLEQALALLKQLQTANPISRTIEERKLYLFKVLREDKSFLLQPHTTSEDSLSSDHVAVLNKGDTDLLLNITSFCYFEAYSCAAEWDSIASGEKHIEKQTFLFADIIIYGEKNRLQDVGKLLDNNKVFLQDPDYRDPKLSYINPHILDLSAVRPEAQNKFEQSKSLLPQAKFGFQDGLSWQITTSQSLLKEKIATAFKNTTRAQNLKRVAADVRIRTTLKLYQEEALDFIMQREKGPVPEEYCLWKPKFREDDVFYKNSITGCEKSQRPVETGGGILADEMGLGKTLTMLSAVIRTADEAKAFASNIYHGSHLAPESTSIPSRATLVVVPSPLLLNEWMQEINQHCDGFSSIIIYHGHGREGNAKALADSDIVLSTYHTISHESSDKTSPLWEIKWFRILLDEAHIIRRMPTKLFKAVRKLRAEYYWCLTGTPVQNSLEDLAALLSFIRISPLDDLYKFRKNIVTPFNRGLENGVDNLRQLLDSVCLRRTKQLLNLPRAIFEVQTLRFSAKEEQRYNDTRDNLVTLINKSGLRAKNQKGCLGVFQLQLQLRRLCNHGTFQKSSLRTDEFDPDQAIAILKKHRISKCEDCGCKVTGIQGIEEKHNGNFTVCGHLLCMKCAQKAKLSLKPIAEQEGSFQCSLCPEIIFSNYFVDENVQKPSKSGCNRLSAWQYFDKEGCSTKISAVVDDIEHQKTEGKSIVFSCCTRSLDLIGIFLTSRKIPFGRIDGSYSLGQRKMILDNYQKDPVVKILLMTTGTGAVGLNLTVANCVYLLEPQWNPMVENQAISRVLRLGQTRNVRVVRYIIKDTVEEKEIRSQQTLKLEYSKAGWKSDESDQEN